MESIKVVSQLRNFKFQSLIEDIRKGRVSLLFSELKSCMGIKKNQKNGKLATFEGEFLMRVLKHICQYLSPKDKSNLTKENTTNIFHSVEFCINLIQKHYDFQEIKKLSDGQYEKTLYHIINNLLSGEHVKLAFPLILHFKDYVQMYPSPVIGNALFIYTDSLFSLIWNFVNKHEKLNANEVFEKRLIALQFLSYNPKQRHALSENSSFAMRMYCKSGNPEYPLISCFLKSIWSNVYKYKQGCSEMCVKKVIFRSTCQWLALLYDKYLGQLRADFLSILEFVQTLAQEHNCPHSKLVNIVSEIAIFYITCVSLKETTSISDSTLASWETLLKVDKAAVEDLKYVASVFSVFLVFLEKLLKFLSNVENMPPYNEIKNNFKIIVCISGLYLKIFGAGLSQPLPDNQSFVITTMLQIILYIFQKDENIKNVSDLLPSLNLYAEKLDIFVSCNENRNRGLEGYVITLGKIAHQFMKWDLYAEAAQYLRFVVRGCEILIAKYAKVSLDETDCFKYYKLLAICYQSLHLYDEALKALVMGLLLRKEIKTSDFELWLKIKKIACRSNCTEVTKKTISHVLGEMNVTVPRVKEISLLENEFLAIKKMYREYECVPEMVAVIFRILKSEPDPETKALMLVELSQIEGITLSDHLPDIDLNSTPFLLCQQASEILLQEIQNKSDNPVSTIRLSYCYFWMYIHKVNEVQAATSEKVEKESNATKDKQEHAEENGDDEESGIKPAFCDVTTVFENKLFKHLNNAVDLWKDIFQSVNNEHVSFKEEIERMNLVEIISTAAEIFWTSGNENQALVAWSLLHEISHHCQNHLYKLISLCSIASLAISQGYFELTGKLIDLAEEIVSDLPEQRLSNWAKLSLSVCKSNYFLYQEKFSDGLKLLKAILESPDLKQNTRKNLSLKFEAKLVLAQYMLLNNSVFTKDFPSNIKGIPRDPITLINRCVSECQQHLKTASNEESRHLSWITWQLKITRLLYQNTLFVSQLYLDIGLPRKAKFLLNQVLYIAQFLFHTYWASKLLIAGGYVDLVCSDFKSCEIKLTGLEYILKMKEGETAELKAPASIQPPDSDEELDDSFLTTRKDIDFRTEVRLDFVKKFEAMSLSPATHNRQKTVKSEIKNPFHCDCRSCLLCSMQFISLEFDLLKCSYLMEKELKFDVTQNLTQLRGFLNRMIENYNSMEELPLFKCYQITGELFQKSIPKSYVYFLITTAIKQAVCNYRIKNIEDAMKNIYETECFLKLYAKVPAKSCPNLFALVTAHKVELCLKFFTIQNILNKPKSQFKSVSKAPTSFNSETFSTPECRKVPPINITECSKSSTFASITNAPTKKSVIPSDIQHGLDNNSPFAEPPSVQSPSIFNLIHDDDKTFKTPLIPQLKCTPQMKVKTKSFRRMQSDHSASSQKGIENEQKSLRTKNYKFFTSKSQEIASINDAKDIWSSTQNLETVFTLTCSTPPRKKTSRRAANRNPTQKTQKSRTKTRSTIRSESHSCSNSTPVKSKFETELSGDTLFDTSAELFDSPTFLSDAIEKPRTKPNSRTNRTASMKINKKCAPLCETPSLDITGKSHNTRSRGKLPSVEMTLSESGNSHAQTIKKQVIKNRIFKSSSSDNSSEDVIGNLSNRTTKNDGTVLLDFTQKEVSEKFVRIFQRDWNLEDLTAALKSSIAAVEHRPPHPLYSELCKMLAMVMLSRAKSSSNYTTVFDIAYLLSESFAVTLKNENVLCLDKKDEKNISQVEESSFKTPPLTPCINVLNEINCQLSKCTSFSSKMHHSLRHLPPEWTVLQICVIKDSFAFGVASEQNLCVCRYHSNTTPYVKLFNLNKQDLKTYLSEFEAIRHENTISTKANDVEQFWKLRMNLNYRLKVFISDMCSNWFSGWKGLFLGLPTNQKRKDKILDIINKLPPLPHMNDQEMLEVLIDTAHTLSIEELSSVIGDLWDTQNDDDMHDTIVNVIRTETSNFKEITRHPVILIVDKDLQYLPWENMPINRSHPTVREPSLYFLNYQLLCHNRERSLLSTGVDSNSTFYLLNPQGDMMRTQTSFEDVFSKKMSWDGIAGRGPNPEEIQRAFTDYELVLYLGHGSGSNYFKNVNDIMTLNCLASAIVMGCCSGSLTKPGPQMEATGDALKYYLGGCPCIVANLWEVTDKDIDLYTKSLLEDWLPNYDGKNMAEDRKLSIAMVVAKARNTCRLRFLNGAAPVIYGLPLFSKI